MWAVPIALIAIASQAKPLPQDPPPKQLPRYTFEQEAPLYTVFRLEMYERLPSGDAIGRSETRIDWVAKRKRDKGDRGIYELRVRGILCDVVGAGGRRLVYDSRQHGAQAPEGWAERLDTLRDAQMHVHLSSRGQIEKVTVSFPDGLSTQEAQKLGKAFEALAKLSFFELAPEPPVPSAAGETGPDRNPPGRNPNEWTTTLSWPFLTRDLEPRVFHFQSKARLRQSFRHYVALRSELTLPDKEQPLLAPFQFTTGQQRVRFDRAAGYPLFVRTELNFKRGNRTFRYVVEATRSPKDTLGDPRPIDKRAPVKKNVDHRLP